MMRRTSGGRSWSDGLCSAGGITGEIEDVEDVADFEDFGDVADVEDVEDLKDLEDLEDLKDVEGVVAMVDILASHGTCPHRTPTIRFFFSPAGFTGGLHRRASPAGRGFRVGLPCRSSIGVGGCNGYGSAQGRG